MSLLFSFCSPCLGFLFVGKGPLLFYNYGFVRMIMKTDFILPLFFNDYN